ncbi:MAG: diguanylate cyclase [Eubacteriales bacterium]
MEMYQNIGNFIDNYGNPFFVGSLVEKKVLFVNKAAKKMFACTEETCDFEKIFERTEERMESMIAKGLKEGGNTLLYDFVAISGAQDKIVVDLQFGFFNEEKTEMFLEIMPKNDDRLTMALHQIQHSPRAEAILNLDEELTILECNEGFDHIFEKNNEMWHVPFRRKLSHGFHADSRSQLLAEIHESLQTNQYYTKDLKILTSQGEEQWYCLELQKQELDNSGVKLMCSLVNIEKQIEAEEKFDLVNQYLSAIQETTVDLLYRVDIATNTMYSYHEFQKIIDNDKVISDYVNTFFDLNTIHPDDKEIYLKGFHEFHENDIICDDPVRFSIGGKPYQWYKITGKKIFDNEGNLKEVFGTLINVDNEVTMKDEVSSLNHYFDALQSISGESFYSVDVKTKVLTQKGQVAKELGFFGVIEDFPESVMHKVHPEDLELYKEFTYNSLKGIAGETRIRVLTAQEEYQWYEILCQIIRDEKGEVSEVVGKMNNIHEEMTMQEEVSTLNKYFDVLNDITDESLYIYNLKTKKLRLGGLTEKELGLPSVLENYPESAFEYIHPDDLELFQKFDGRVLDSGENRLEVRLKNVDGKFQWYELLSGIIYDNSGNPSEIFGRIKNIQAKHNLKIEIEEANNYLLVMQELSDDILYRIDVDAKTLVYTTKSKNGEIVTNTFENYPQSTFDENLMHPEDEKLILEQTDAWLSGNMQQYKLRMKLVTEDYEWYQDSAINIRDKDGRITEIYGRLQNIHAEETMVAEVSTLNQYVEAVQSLSGESLFYVDMKTRILRQKGEVAVELGVPDEIPNFPEGAYPFIHPEDLENYEIFAKDTLNGKASSVQSRVRTATGEYQWYEIISMHIYDKTGDMVEIFGRMTNINKEITIKDDYSALNQYFTAMQNLSQNLLFHIDMKTKTFKHADTNALSFGVPAEIPNFIDTFIKSGFVRPEDGDKYREYTEKILSGENMEYEIQAAVSRGVYEWFHVTSQYIHNEKGEPVEIFGMMENIQNKKDLEQKASHDLMTNVLNKVSFEQESENVLLKVSPDQKHALIFIDLDDFKGVNDNLGHIYGDVLLTTVGKRLKHHVREGDLVGRIGGDEFAVLLCNISDEESVLDRTNTMLDSVKRNFSHDGVSVGIKASVGVAVYPEHGKNYKDLISKSDIAVYESKRRGKNVVSIYSKEFEEH